MSGKFSIPISDRELTSEIPQFPARLTATILAALEGRPESHFHILIPAGDQISGPIQTSHFVRGNYTGRLPRRANKHGSQSTPDRQIKASDWQGNAQTSACWRRPSFGFYCGSLVCMRMRTRVVFFAVFFPPRSISTSAVERWGGIRVDCDLDGRVCMWKCFVLMAQNSRGAVGQCRSI